MLQALSLAFSYGVLVEKTKLVKAFIFGKKPERLSLPMLKRKKRIAFVSVDIGSIEHHITLEVLNRLKQQFGNDYRLDNVILSATHTHAAPTGYWHSRSELGLDGGFYPEHFNNIVDGIVEAIGEAHQDLQPGDIYINRGRVEGRWN